MLLILLFFWFSILCFRGIATESGCEGHIHITRQRVLADFVSLTSVVPLWDGDVSGDGGAASDNRREGEVTPS